MQLDFLSNARELSGPSFPPAETCRDQRYQTRNDGGSEEYFVTIGACVWLIHHTKKITDYVLPTIVSANGQLPLSL